MNIDWESIAKHEQRGHYSCIPSAIEMVLKLLGKVEDNYYDLQKKWKAKPGEDFSVYHGKAIEGLAFTHRFAGIEHPRGDDFPLKELFSTIDTELAEARFVIASLPNLVHSQSYGGYLLNGFHMWVIYARTDHDYLALSKAFRSELDEVARVIVVTDEVKHRVRIVQGTDILTYRPVD
ncbi:hypothetical protein JXM67_07885 [candidate division WOR-3 bacterium]|nr:hypothetical protein [candidate division WOR-3 bacterium]